MFGEEMFLPGFEPKKPADPIKKIRQDKKPEEISDQDRDISKAPENNANPCEEEVGGAVDGCPECDIHGAIGCQRHRKR